MTIKVVDKVRSTQLAKALMDIAGKLQEWLSGAKTLEVGLMRARRVAVKLNVRNAYG